MRRDFDVALVLVLVVVLDPLLLGSA